MQLHKVWTHNILGGNTNQSFKLKWIRSQEQGAYLILIINTPCRINHFCTNSSRYKTCNDIYIYFEANVMNTSKNK